MADEGFDGDGASGAPALRGRATWWLACGAAVLAGLGGAVAGAAAHPVSRQARSAANLRTIVRFIESEPGDDAVVSLAVLTPQPDPAVWTVAWVTADGRHCVAGAENVDGVVMAHGCDAAAGSPLAGGAPHLMMMPGYGLGEMSVVGHPVLELPGFVRGAAKITATWGGAPLPVRLVPLGLPGDPGLEAFLVEAPQTAKAGILYAFSIAAYDASGAEIGHEGPDQMRVG